ncbi:MAG TPA: hypothetical protein VGQ16_15340 [Vicinamibacterales bacterium]|jgi:hypothetical protein|nr:hypothetical protein [Vicinamibacterales bacterium]
MLNLLAVTLVDLGIVGILAGLASLVKPLRFLGIRSRLMGAAAIAASIALIAAGMFAPAPLQHVAEARTDLDRAMPDWHFSERHSTTIRATPERVYQAIKAVPANDILFFRTLIWIRRLGQPLPPGILNAPENEPLLGLATRTSFATLADGPQEIVVGTVVVAPREAARSVRLPTTDEFLALRARGGFALATMNFAIRPTGQGTCDVTTETRVFGTGPDAARRFGAYWRVIYPGSSLIRYMWLRAIKKRAEAPAATLSGGQATPRFSVSDSSRRGAHLRQGYGGSAVARENRWRAEAEGPAASGKKLASSLCGCN